MKNRIIELNNNLELRNFYLNQAELYIKDFSPYKQVEQIMEIYDNF